MHMDSLLRQRTYDVSDIIGPAPKTASNTLIAGEYTLIVSAFEPRQQGTFTINVESARAFDLTPLPAEGAGMYSKTVRGQW
jgi:hypothetical protein